MRKIIIAVLVSVCCAWQQVHALITVDAVTTNYVSSGLSNAWTHTVGTEGDRMLVVGASWRDEGTVVINSVKFGAHSFTRATNTFARCATKQSTELWYLVAPTSGSSLISVVWNGAEGGTYCGAISLAGVKQQAPEATTANGYADVYGTTYSTAITTLTTNAWVIDVVGNGATGGSFTNTTAGMTERWDINGSSYGSGAGSTREVTSPGTVTNTWTCTQSHRRTQSMVAFEPAPANNTYTITYDANGATSGTVPSNQTKTQDVTLVLSTNVGTLAKTGYTFSGWNTTTNGSGTSYAEGANYTANVAATLYGKWLNLPPGEPTIISPTNNAVDVEIPPTLTVSVTDPEASALSVEFFGRTNVANESDFTLVHIPDTQFYSQNGGGTRLAIGVQQLAWIVTNCAASNIVAAFQSGDVVDYGSDEEFQNSTNFMYRLFDSTTTGKPDGIPWSISMGILHDGDGSLWNTYYGTNLFTGRSYWGGSYNTNNANNYILFSAGHLDFVTLMLDSFAGTNTNIMAWANGVLQAYPSRRAIVVSHSILETTTRPTPSAWTTEGQAKFDGLKANTNLFLMLCGHAHGIGFRHEVVSGRSIDIILADYQTYTNGGNGWFRQMVVHPTTGVMDFRTYSAYVTNSLTDADNQFSITNSLLLYTNTASFTSLGTNTSVTSGQQTSRVWSNLSPLTAYDWYATASDGTSSTASDYSVFTTSTGGTSSAVSTWSLFEINHCFAPNDAIKEGEAPQ